MLASYHNHTSRCLHAEGADEEYVKAAIEAGVKLLGFADHAPMPYPEGYESYYKMRREELSEYCTSVLLLKEKYADKTVLLVCHNCVCRMVRSFFVNMSTEEYGNYHAPNAQLVEYEM